MFRHVLCVYPYRVEASPRNHVYPPLGLEIIAARLKPESRSIDVIDLRRESCRAADFVRPDTDLVCFSVNWEIERESIREEILSVPRGVRVMVGGQYPSRDPEWWLSECPNIDIIVRGDGADAVGEIAQGRPLEEIVGISYRSNGRVAHNGPRDPARLPDDFFPDRRLRRYRYALEWPGIRTGLTFDTIASSSGCPYNCTFCSFNRDPWGARRPWSARSPESVVRELSEIDAKVVGFVDLEFLHDADRVAAICDLIVERGIRKSLVANARIEIARRPDVLGKMERAGFAAVLLGIESAQDRTLRAMKKGFDTRQIREHFRVLRRSRMILHGTFILGYFGDSEKDMLKVVPFAREIGLDTLNLCLFRNERNSGLQEFVARNPGYHIAPSGDIFSDRYPMDHLRRLRDRMFRKFYTPGQIFHVVKKGIRNGIITPRMLARLGIFMGHAVAGRFNPARMRPFPRGDGTGVR